MQQSFNWLNSSSKYIFLYFKGLILTKVTENYLSRRKDGKVK